MKKISISKDLGKLTPDQFKKWFEDKQKKGKFPEGDKWEKHYEALQPKREAKKKAPKE